MTIDAPEAGAGVPAPVAAGSPVEVDLLQKLDDGRPLPRRDRVTSPLTYVLLGVVALAGSFVLGAWVEKHHGAKPATTATATTGSANANAAAAAGGFAGRGGANANANGAAAAGGGAGGAAGALGNATVGQVKLVDGNNVYVTTQDGTIVKVKVDPSLAIQVTKQGTVADLTTGETVIVQGDAGADGTVNATSVRLGGAAGFGGRAGGAGAGAATTPAAPTSTVAR